MDKDQHTIICRAKGADCDDHVDETQQPRDRLATHQFAEIAVYASDYAMRQAMGCAIVGHVIEVGRDAVGHRMHAACA